MRLSVDERLSGEWQVQKGKGEQLRVCEQVTTACIIGEMYVYARSPAGDPWENVSQSGPAEGRITAGYSPRRGVNYPEYPVGP